MSRINRRKWTEEQCGILSSGGIHDAFDNAIKSIYRITDEEYDFICDNAIDGELTYIITKNPSFSDKREIIKILNKYVKYQ